MSTGVFILKLFSILRFSHVVTVTVAPQVVPFDFGDEPINAGDMTSLTCTINKGDFPIKISWMHNGAPVDSKEDITIIRPSKRIGTLSIDSVQAHHAGEYTCVAKNKAGSATYSAILNVNGTWYLAIRR